MVGVEEGRELRFRGNLYSQESTFPLVCDCGVQNKVVMIAGIVAFTGAISYLAYYRATVMNQPNSYMAMTERGELEKRTRTSRWD